MLTRKRHKETFWHEGYSLCLDLDGGCMCMYLSRPLNCILKIDMFYFISVIVAQLLSHVDSLCLHGLQHTRLTCPSLSLSLLKLMSIESVMPSNHLAFCRPLLLLPLIFPSIRVISNESDLCIRWPEYWCFSFSISSSN